MVGWGCDGTIEQCQCVSIRVGGASCCREDGKTARRHYTGHLKTPSKDKSPPADIYDIVNSLELRTDNNITSTDRLPLDPAMSTTTSSTDHHILLVGLDPLDPPPNAPVPPSVLQSIAEKISIDMARAARNGYPFTTHYLDWRDNASALRKLEEVLEEGRSDGKGLKKWEAIMFGQGIRMHKDPVLFEGAIAAVRRVFAGDEVKIVFNDGADRQCWAIERNFGIVMKD